MALAALLSPMMLAIAARVAVQRDMRTLTLMMVRT